MANGFTDAAVEAMLRAAGLGGAELVRLHAGDPDGAVIGVGPEVAAMEADPDVDLVAEDDLAAPDAPAVAEDDDPLADLSWLTAGVAPVANEWSPETAGADRDSAEAREIRDRWRARGMTTEEGREELPSGVVIRGCECVACVRGRERGLSEEDPWVSERPTVVDVSAWTYRHNGVDSTWTATDEVQTWPAREVYLHGGPADGRRATLRGPGPIAVPDPGGILPWELGDGPELAARTFTRVLYEFACDLLTARGTRVQVWSVDGAPLSPQDRQAVAMAVDGPPTDELVAAFERATGALRTALEGAGRAFGEMAAALRPALTELANMGVIRDPRPTEEVQARIRPTEEVQARIRLARRHRGSGPPRPGPGERLGRAR